MKCVILLVLHLVSVLAGSISTTTAGTGAIYTCSINTLYNQPGNVYCFGSSFNGQHGYTNATIPVSVPPGLENIPCTSVVALFYHACALSVNQDIWCWGNNQYGAVNPANGITTKNANYTFPPMISVPAKFKAVGGTNYMSCGIAVNGTLICWGANIFVTNTPMMNISTVSLPGQNVVSFSGGSTFMCYIEASVGGLFCGGSNTYNQLGPRGSSSIMPIFDTKYTGTTLVACGSSSTCLINSTGLSCMGNQLAITGGTSGLTAPFPFAVIKDSTIVQVSLGFYHICWTTSNYSLYCMGNDQNVQVPAAIPNITYGFSTPQIMRLQDRQYKEVSAGGIGTCALTTDNAVDCWGNGPIAGASSVNQFIASPVSQAVIGVSAGNGITCIWNNTGLYCVGIYAYNALGDSFGWSILLSQYTKDFVLMNVPNPASITSVQHSSGGYYTCALTGAELYCWGCLSANQPCSVGFPTPTLVSRSVKAFTVGNSVACLIYTDGVAACWGSNMYNSLGVPGSTVSSSTTYYYNATNITIAGVGRYTSIAACEYATCAITTTNALHCWGKSSGYIAGASPGNSVITSLTADVMEISTSLTTACVIMRNSSVVCFGDNSRGVMPGITTTTPVPPTVMTNLAGVSQIAHSFRGASYGTGADGTVYSWGYNFVGTYYDNNNFGIGYATTIYPVTIRPELKGVTNISVGASHACGILNGVPVCWGLATSYTMGPYVSNRDTIIRAFPGQQDQVACGKNGTRGYMIFDVYCFNWNQDDNTCASHYCNVTTPVCDPATTCSANGQCTGDGSCECNAGYTGDSCNQCATGYYNYPSCVSCNAATNCTSNGQCNQVDGTCACNTGYYGQNCNQCATGYYNYPSCVSCNAATNCSSNGQCNVKDGSCTCNARYAGIRCDSCAAGYINYPACSVPTSAPTTAAPTTAAPTTAAPTTSAPTTSAPTTSAPVTSAPTTSAPVTSAPVTSSPTTSAPTYGKVVTAPSGFNFVINKAAYDQGLSRVIASSTGYPITLQDLTTKNNNGNYWNFTGTSITGYAPLTNLCFDVKHNAIRPNTQVGIYSCNGAENQKWTYSISSATNMWAQIHSSTNPALCLAPANGGSTAVGTSMVLVVCNSTANNQLWSINATAIASAPASTSAPTTSGLTPTLPSAVATPSVTVSSDNIATVTYSPPRSNGNAAINYTVVFYSNATTLQQVTNTTTVDTQVSVQLPTTNTTTMWVGVIVNNVVGSSPLSTLRPFYAMCPTGQTRDRSNNCFACPAGLIPTSGNYGCSACPAGTSTNGSSGATECTPCAAGTYAGGRSATCTNCPSGKTSSAGASSCQ